MHAIDLLAKCVPGELLQVERRFATCCVTGTYCLCIPRGVGIPHSFTSRDWFNAPRSEWVGAGTYNVLHYRPERASSWYCNGDEFRRLDRKGVREMVLSGRYDPQWSAYATTSYKKHGSVWAVVNTPPGAVWRFEMLDVDCSDHGRVECLWKELLEWASRGIGRQVMESGICPPSIIKKIGAKTWMEFERWVRPIRLSRLYLFLCYLLPCKNEVAKGQSTEIMDHPEKTHA